MMQYGIGGKHIKCHRKYIIKGLPSTLEKPVLLYIEGSL